MDQHRALSQYHATDVQTSSPLRIVVLLYEGALRFMSEAEVAIADRNHPRKADRINRAVRIVQELGNALDVEAAPELSEQLAGLYAYAEYELLQASAFNDPVRVRNVRAVIERLLGSWQELAERNVSAPADESTPAGDTAGHSSSLIFSA